MGMSRTVRAGTRRPTRLAAAAVAVAAAVATGAFGAFGGFSAAPTPPVRPATSAAPPMSSADRAWFHRFVATAVPAPRATAAPAPAVSTTAPGIQFPGDEAGGYHRYIVELTGPTPGTEGTPGTVGPDGRPGRWVRLNAPGTPAVMTQEQEATLLPWMADLVRDTEGSVWLLLRADAPAGLGAAQGPAAEDGLRALPDTTVTPIDAQHVAVRTTASPQTLASTPGVAGVTSDALMSLAVTPGDVSNDPMSNQQWALQNRGDTYLVQPGDMLAGADAKVPPAWTKTRGAGSVVAVIDTPVDASHPDLAAALWTNPAEPCNATSDGDGDGLVADCHGWDFVNGNATGQLRPGTNQSLQHGTHVAGIIAATAGNGIGVAGAAPAAQIMPLNVAMSNGQIPVSAAAAAINYAVDHHATVINASWGGSGAMPSVLQNAINRADAAGIVMAIAAGNNGTNLDASPQFPASATNTNVITVGASTATDQPASFSNFSPTQVDVFAPGSYVLSALPNNRYGMMSGTSMAAPYVAAEAALLRAADPSMTASQVRNRIMVSADVLPALAGRAASAGRIDVAAALGVAPGSSPSGTATFDFNDFNNLDDTHAQQPAVRVQTSAGSVPAGHGAALAFTFATRTAVNQAMAITNFPFAMTLTDGRVVVATTDATGTATVAGIDPSALPAGASYGLQTSLPAGLYAINAQLRDSTTGLPVGLPGRMVFAVGVTPGTEPATTTTVPGPTTPTTAAPAPTTGPTPTTGTTTTVPERPTTPTAPAAGSPTTTTTGPGSTTPTTAPGRTTTTAPTGTTLPTGPATTTTRPRAATSTTTLPPPPTGPTNLIGAAGDGVVALQWSAVPGATGYRVYRGTMLAAQTTTTHATVTGLTNGTPYPFSVTAFTAFGESVPSNTVTLTPAAPPATTTTSIASSTTAPVGSTTTVRRAPTTTAPATTVPATTVPGPTTVPVPTPPPGSVTVVPMSGPASGGTTIVVASRYPIPHDGLSIDGAFATITNFTTFSVTATTAIHVVPGTYDVVLYDRAGNRTVVPAAFTYQPVAGRSPTSTTTTTTTATTTGPRNPPTTTTGPNVPTTTPGSPTTRPPVTDPPPPTPTTPATVPIPPAVTRPGRNTRLQLAPLPAFGPLSDLPAALWDGMTCRLASCRG